MTYDAFKKLCEDEWKIGYGAVKELHLDEAAYQELKSTVPGVRKIPGFPDDIGALVNEITGDYVEIHRHHNHAVIERPPQPPATRHEVNV